MRQVMVDIISFKSQITQISPGWEINKIKKPFKNGIGKCYPYFEFPFPKQNFLPMKFWWNSTIPVPKSKSRPNSKHFLPFSCKSAKRCLRYSWILILGQWQEKEEEERLPPSKFKLLAGKGKNQKIVNYSTMWPIIDQLLVGNYIRIDRSSILL